METKDHYFLSKILARRMHLNTPKTFAFILGNVFPDLNPFSYLRGTGAADLEGHSFGVRRQLIGQVYSHGFKDSVSGWFHAGEMMHYIADSFTRPHNKQFNYSLRQHVIYERRLHAVLSNRLSPSRIIQHAKPDTDIGRFDPWLENLHQQYIHSSSSPGDDCRYILHSALTVCDGLTQKCAMQKLQPVLE